MFSPVCEAMQLHLASAKPEAVPYMNLQLLALLQTAII